MAWCDEAWVNEIDDGDSGSSLRLVEHYNLYETHVLDSMLC